MTAVAARTDMWREGTRLRTEHDRLHPPGPARRTDLIDPMRPGRRRWHRQSDGYVLEGHGPDSIAERNERLAYLMRQRRSWRLINGSLVERGHPREELADTLLRAMELGRGEWKDRMRALGMAGIATAAEGTYGALGAYPLAAELGAVTPTTTEAGLISAANAAILMPIPANGLLAPQAYRFVVAGRATTSATAANYTWTPRLGNANTSPSLGASAALAKTISLTNAMIIMKGDVTIESVGAPGGTNSKAFGHFTLHLNSAVGGAAIVWVWGSTAQASFDASVSPGASANGGQFWLGTTASAAAADTVTIGAVHYMDWN